MQNKKVGAGHLGLGDDIFSSICGTFFQEIPDEQFNLGHWSYLFNCSNEQHEHAYSQ